MAVRDENITLEDGWNQIKILALDPLQVFYNSQLNTRRDNKFLVVCFVGNS